MTEPRGPIGWANQQAEEREQQPARKLLDQMSDRELVELYERAKQAEEQLATLALIFEGFGRLLATSSRDWGAYRVDAWLWAVTLGWDCEDEPCDIPECAHDVLEQFAREFGWGEEGLAKARRYRAAVRALTEPKEPRPPAIHVGNRVNAEDCPACHGTNPPYPFICPGPETP